MQPTKKHQKSFLHTFGIVSVGILALVIIAVSVFSLMNPNGIETTNEESAGLATITDAGITPEVIRVAQGQSVTWENKGTKPRSLVITSSNPEQTLEGFGTDEAIMKDESYSFVFDLKGSFTYEDTSEPEKIKGTVIVE